MRSTRFQLTLLRRSACQLLLAGALAATPASAQTYTFTSCSGVTATANISSVMPSPPVTFGLTTTYSGALVGTFSLTGGGYNRTTMGLGSYAIAFSTDASTGLKTTNFGIMAAGVSATNIPNGWTANLQGAGFLLPQSSNLPATLPPLSTWTVPALGALSMCYDYISPTGLPAVCAPGASNPNIVFLACSQPGGGNPPPPSTSPTDESLGDPTNTPTICPCAQPSVGEPINIAIGNLFERVADYRTSGANQLAFIRYYNSLAGSNTFAAALGPKWRTNYDRYLRLVSSSSVVAERPDGQQVPFTLSGSTWTTDTDIDLKLTNFGSTWTLTDMRDTVETYSAVSSTEAILKTIRARNGYTQTLAYDSNNVLTAVADSYNRQLSFVYAGGLLQTVTTPDLVLTYGYTNNQLTSVSYPTTPVTGVTYLYENSAFPSALTGIIDENGNRFATWTYDSTGRATSSQHAGGADLTKIAYNDTDGSRTVTDPLGVQMVYKFTTLQNMPKVTEIDRLAGPGVSAATSKFTYDTNGYTASQTDWNGNLTNYVNDVHGQTTSLTEAAGTSLARTTTITYHSTFHLPVQIVTPGLTVAFNYDNNGELLTRTLTDTTTTTAPYSTSGQTRTWTYTYSNFLPASAKTPRSDVNGVTKFSYDSSGALTAVTNALNQTAQVAQHLAGGLPQTIVDANGVETDLTYDPRLRLLSSTIDTAAGPLTSSYTYDAAENLLSITLADGSSAANSYDDAHRLTSVTDLFSQTIAYTLDAAGDRTQTNVFDASGNQQRTRSDNFDALARLQQDIGGAGQTTSFAYDALGNLLTLTDPLSRATQRAFDALNRPVKITDPAKGVTTNTYDAHNRLTSLTDPNGGVTNYVYDGFGELIQQASPDSGTTVYRYDADGNLTQKVDATGATTNYTYDALDRVTKATYPSDAAENVTYTYDQPGNGFGIGRLTSVTDAAGTLSRSYDERGNLLTETRVNSGVTLVTAYTYDVASRIASITYPSGWMVAHTRDAMGRTTALTAQSPDGSTSLPILTNVAYQPFGPVNALVFGNGVAETRSFDLDYRIINLADNGAAAFQNLSYNYDAANNVSSIADGVTSTNSQNLGYDSLDRLVNAAGGYGSYAYTYDSVGNRLTENAAGSPATFSYTAHSNQLASLNATGTPQTVGYTKAGNISALANTNFTYNQAGRLATVTMAGSQAAQYIYDAFGQRLVRVGAMTATTLYQYGRGGHLLEETDGQGNPLVDYIYLGALPVATLSPASAQVYYLHDDRLGTPQLATDINQNSVWAASYGPFGEMATVPSGIVQDLRLPGQEFDVETGFYHNGFRDYVPAWGRYLQSDPIGLFGGLNTYGYAGANPVGSVDPMGLCPGPQQDPQLAELARENQAMAALEELNQIVNDTEVAEISQREGIDQIVLQDSWLQQNWDQVSSLAKQGSDWVGEKLREILSETSLGASTMNQLKQFVYGSSEGGVVSEIAGPAGAAYGIFQAIQPGIDWTVHQLQTQEQLDNSLLIWSAGDRLQRQIQAFQTPATPIPGLVLPPGFTYYDPNNLPAPGPVPHVNTNDPAFWNRLGGGASH